MHTNTIKENKMGTMPIPRLLITISLPMILSMLVQALYNIVDSIFVARLSEDALTAVSLVFPVQNLMIAIAVGTGVGINALLSRHLGERNFSEANAVAKNGVFLALISYIIFAIIGGLSAYTFFTIQTTNPDIIKYGTQYMVITSTLSFGIFFQITFERLLQSTGKTFYNMITQGTGAIINIILDPILIFGLFGFPRLEVAGAAIATILGQIVAVSMSLYFNLKKNKEVNISPKGFRPDGGTILAIYKIGFPSIIMQAIGSVMLFGINKILLMFSSTSAAVFGVYFRLQSFIFMPVFGLTNGIIPIVAYNYGARNKSRIMQTLKLGIIMAVSIMFVGTVFFQLFPRQLLLLFDASDNMIAIGIPALRIISIGFSLAGYIIVCSSFFQALGNGMYSLIISVFRQLIIILPIAFTFSHFFGLDMVWWAFPLSDFGSVFLSTFLLYRIYKFRVKHLE